METPPKGRRQLIVDFVALYNKVLEYLRRITPNSITEPINEDLLTTAPNVTALELEGTNNTLATLRVSVNELLNFGLIRDFKDFTIPTPDQIEETNRPELIALYWVFSYIYPAINEETYRWSDQEYHDKNTYLEYISYTTNREQTSTPNISEDIRAQSWELIAEDLGEVDDTEEDDRPNGAGRPTAPNILIQLAERATNAEEIQRLRQFLDLIGRAKDVGLINISPNAISWNIGTYKEAYKQPHVKYFVERVSEVFNLKKTTRKGRTTCKAIQWEAWKRFISGIENLAGADDPKEAHTQEIDKKIFRHFPQF
jgi:hypothetical protein